MSLFDNFGCMECNHIYEFKSDFDAYLCGVGRVQAGKGAVCECRSNGSLYFLNSKNYLPYEAVQLIAANPNKYLNDITAMYVGKFLQDC